jgi:serine/threonine protein kinase
MMGRPDVWRPLIDHLQSISHPTMFIKHQKPLQEVDSTKSAVRASNESLELNQKLEIGDLFAGRFRVLNRLGSGGMGDVFKVEDVAVKRIVALKILQSGFTTNANSMKRFQQEAKAAGSLDHPNIAKLLEFGMTNGSQPYLVLEYCPGESLSEYLKSSGSLSEMFAREVVTQISHALEHAHAKGVVHRDLKPANVVLVRANDQCKVKVIDFGIAKILSSDDSPGLTKTGEIFGSPLYMSPEQADSGVITERSDQYSLGCLFYECLTGAPPHIGKTSIETLIKHRTEVPRSLKEASLGSEFSANTQSIVERLLQKDPGDRYPSIVDVTQAFNQPLPASAVRADLRERPVPISRKRNIYVVILSATIAVSSAFIAHQWTEISSTKSHNESSSAVVPSNPIHLPTLPVSSSWNDTTSADAICVNEERSNPQQTKFDMQGQNISNEGLRGFATHRQVT